jgi:hypothetical protein
MFPPGRLPGQFIEPAPDAFIESYNSRFRQECLNEPWFWGLEDAKEGAKPAAALQ